MHDRVTSGTKLRAAATIAVVLVAGAALTAGTVAADTIAVHTPWLLLPT